MMRSDEWQCFLRAIIARPDDDLPRLIAADRLDENGEPERAEFIRVQVSLATAGQCHGLPAAECDIGDDGPLCPVCRLLSRERELGGFWDVGYNPGLINWNRVYEKEFVSNVDSGVWRHQFRRGFIESITLPARDLIRHANAIFAAQPVTEVRLGGAEFMGKPISIHRAPGVSVATFQHQCVETARMAHWGAWGPPGDLVADTLLSAWQAPSEIS